MTPIRGSVSWNEHLDIIIDEHSLNDIVYGRYVQKYILVYKTIF